MLQDAVLIAARKTILYQICHHRWPAGLAMNNTDHYEESAGSLYHA